MDKQKEMEAAFHRAHTQFMSNLEDSIEYLEDDINKTAEMDEICTDEWCQATEGYLDDIAKMVFSISEPRWLSKEESRKISRLRHKVHDLYAQYKSARAS